MTQEEALDFMAYLAVMTDDQVRGCYSKERAAGREGYVVLCCSEANRRGFLDSVNRDYREEE